MGNIIKKEEEKEEENVPVVLKTNDKCRLYYKKDNKFLVPKAYIYIKVFCNDCEQGQNSQSSLFT